MQSPNTSRRARPASSLGATLLMAVFLLNMATSAQELTDSQAIINRLSNKPKLRAMQPDGGQNRDLGIAAQRIDLDIPFLNNSDTLGRGALRQLTELGTALNSEELHAARFLIAGHTSSTGKPDHNLKLSEARAAAVKKYLVDHFNMPDGRLQTTGLGASAPRPNYSPAADQQRRVEIRVLAQAGQDH